VHGVAKHETLFDAALLEALLHLRGDVEEGPAARDIKPEFFTIAFQVCHLSLIFAQPATKIAVVNESGASLAPGFFSLILLKKPLPGNLMTVGRALPAISFLGGPGVSLVPAQAKACGYKKMPKAGSALKLSQKPLFPPNVILSEAKNLVFSNT
jgi:hypothetical protein